ncbi:MULTISPECIES: membrane lipoprotein lipid attachment site-containing protein [Psychrilyobacter]|uniref:DUF2846 domain-containing protein n=1 Tax=Psychrilyobacter piezotolerans TaxID=2293438 RepID=A0ABX9KKH7_9FUSO|nr:MULTISPECIES: membrane lipoprotein lipid attachment site-containing protein [Psychrilyobacter]MCS5421869.1 membrane lipoprotein lipid attachment site-containing protein [Psychrilyobacter sp. S5]NDI76760.1 lipoprotein [Psychrilyobacter piezotolerans]RDE65378.1 hypothetical protein DV867_02285 [Psychrilyobacter sp. S5]REI42996.1 hypothetical protein DYH56_02285 [Psychrilyobacter piezotolerans]
MKKIIFIIVTLLTIAGCSSAEKKEGKILKNQDFDGAVKIRFEGRAERVFISGDVVNLGHEYYLVPGEYVVSWNPRSYISIGVSVGGSGNNNDMEQRSNARIVIEKDSVVKLKGDSADLTEAGGKL